MQHRTAHQLVEACLEGDQSAWDQLIDDHAQLVYAVARRQGLGESDVEDVFQAVFMNLFRSLSRVRDAESIPKWLITSAKRESWRVARWQRETPMSALGDPESAPPRSDSASTDENDIEQFENEHTLRLALSQVGRPCTELLTALFASSGPENYESVAQSLGMPIGSIGPTRSRCLSKLRKRLEALGLEDING